MTDIPVQTSIFTELGAPEPVPTKLGRAPRQPAAPRWKPCTRIGACTDCYEAQHAAALDGRPVGHRHRVAWSYGDDLYCTPHAAERGCVKAGALRAGAAR